MCGKRAAKSLTCMRFEPRTGPKTQRKTRTRLLASSGSSASIVNETEVSKTNADIIILCTPTQTIHTVAKAEQQKEKKKERKKKKKRQKREKVKPSDHLPAALKPFTSKQPSFC